MKLHDLFETATQDIEIAKVSKAIAKQIYGLYHSDHTFDYLASAIFSNGKRPSRYNLTAHTVKLGDFKLPKISDPTVKHILDSVELGIRTFDNNDGQKYTAAAYFPPIKSIAVANTTLDKVSSVDKIASILAHEIRHALDDYLSKGKIFPNTQDRENILNSSDAYIDYLRIPAEVNGRFTEAISSLYYLFRKKDGKITKDDVNDILTVANINTIYSSDDKKYRRLQIRLYKAIEEMKKDYEEETRSFTLSNFVRTMKKKLGLRLD